MVRYLPGVKSALVGLLDAARHGLHLRCDLYTRTRWCGGCKESAAGGCGGERSPAVVVPNFNSSLR